MIRIIRKFIFGQTPKSANAPHIFLALCVYSAIIIPYTIILFPEETFIRIATCIAIIALYIFFERSRLSVTATAFASCITFYTLLAINAVFYYDYLLFTFSVAITMIGFSYLKPKAIAMYIVAFAVPTAILLIFDVRMLGHVFSRIHHILFFITSVSLNILLYIFCKFYERTLSDLRNAKEDIEKEKEFTTLMLDSSPLSCLLWDSDKNNIDCNEAAIRLFGFKNKHDYLSSVPILNPKYQPNGMLSDELIDGYIKKAVKEGQFSVNWTYKMLDGTIMPADVTFVHVKHHDDYLIAEYTRDLREKIKMENKISHLEIEANKIHYDSLTEIHNRRYFDLKIKQIMRSCARTNSPLSLLMVDIDYFKRFNDTYGHSTGDKCLKLVAKALSDCIKRVDEFVARYGGEEFVVVLPNTNDEGAHVIANKMLDSIRNLNIPHEKSDVADHVTVSVGGTFGFVSRKQRSEDYVNRADSMLYKSKQNGRNKYSYAPVDINIENQ